MKSLNCNGTLLNLSTPRVMGILNVTPDSFYDGGQYETSDALAKRVDTLVSEGTDIIDIGGMSSRPGADIISTQEEQDRVLPVIKYIRETHPEMLLSIDTIHAATARAAVQSGAHIINDISGGAYDAEMIATAADLECPYIAMHMQGTPATMQKDPQYNDVVLDILKEFAQLDRACNRAGVKDLVVDPGYGFGKTVEHNYELLRGMSALRILERPILVGISRKSMIYRALGRTPEEALNGTTALHMIALQNGADILRVHDVKEAKECIQLYGLTYPSK